MKINKYLDIDMTISELKELVSADYKRITNIPGMSNPLFHYLVSNSAAITIPFRIGNYLKSKESFIARILLIFIKLIYRFNKHYNGIQLPLGTNIGGGVMFAHYGSIVIATDSRIGKNVTIHQDVTIGRSFAGSKHGCPIIGNNVIIFAGAKIIGHVTIGNNVVIGANAVVTNDIPDNSVAVGIPAKVISHNSDNCFEERWSKYFGRNL